ncbi:hypothetical protein [Micromonospora sp. CV4]|uniref:hypothetical protein n=1 Tax=Micromonospora sp. CV4 TaxID=2478711 RepID=UPI000EF53A52|nr:hypothetical protein [Micromonospora sp. CV4]RLP87576.1 hypothetical protein EAD98_27000 [Micromonospora sp. CV4]
MGMIRKLTSVSTLGLVDWSNPKEKQAKAARRSSKADERVSKAEAARLEAETALLRAQLEELKKKDA